MNRRGFMKLLALTPLAGLIKAKPLTGQEFYDKHGYTRSHSDMVFGNNVDPVQTWDKDRFVGALAKPTRKQPADKFIISALGHGIK